jgi:splicing factor 45
MSNSSNPTPPARGSGLSLYANLLDPDNISSSATVSKGPVVFKPAEAADEASAKKPQIDSCIYYNR